RGHTGQAARTKDRDLPTLDHECELGRIYVDLKRREVETAPEYDPNVPLERAFESRLHEHHRRPVYWDEERARPPLTADARQAFVVRTLRAQDGEARALPVSRETRKGRRPERISEIAKTHRQELRPWPPPAGAPRCLTFTVSRIFRRPLTPVWLA